MDKATRRVALENPPAENHHTSRHHLHEYTQNRCKDDVGLLVVLTWARVGHGDSKQNWRVPEATPQNVQIQLRRQGMLGSNSSVRSGNGWRLEMR